MNILVAADKKHMNPLKVMLTSLFLNNPKTKFDIYLMYINLDTESIRELSILTNSNRSSLIQIKVEASFLDAAPNMSIYPKEKYFRLLAHRFLPTKLDRILYLDTDILVLNRIDELYNIDFKCNLYGAAFHKISLNIFNKIRLFPYAINQYYNSDILMLNLSLLRKDVDERTIFAFLKLNTGKLLIPDQDILNSLYSDKIIAIDEQKYNFNSRHYIFYKNKSKQNLKMERFLKEIVILHFSGRIKPWENNYRGNFQKIYSHYETLFNAQYA